MRAVIQRVSRTSVVVHGTQVSAIESGLLVLLGIETADNGSDTDWLCRKIVNLRIFDDASGVMNKSVRDIDGGIVVVSQFTLYASTKKGNRPSYNLAAPPDMAKSKYTDFIIQLEKIFEKPVGMGVFGAHMKLDFINDGPVTIIIDTKNKVQDKLSGLFLIILQRTRYIFSFR